MVASSALLFHGPAAREKALTVAHEIGRLLQPPFGESGLKIAESREIVSLINNAPVGDRKGVIVMGPMDEVSAAASDVLLKSLEDFDSDIVHPVLWAHNEADVRSTIRSRCLLKWCPGDDTQSELADGARQLVDSALQGHTAEVIEILKDTDVKEILRAAAKVLSTLHVDGEALALWERARKVLTYPNPTKTEVLAVFI